MKFNKDSSSASNPENSPALYSSVLSLSHLCILECRFIAGFSNIFPFAPEDLPVTADPQAPFPPFLGDLCGGFVFGEEMLGALESPLPWESNRLYQATSDS